MSATPKVFRKNLIDLDYSQASISVTDEIADNDGQFSVDFLRNRDNESGFATTGSSDAANTQLDVDIGDLQAIDSIVLVMHNFKSYTIQYKDPDSGEYTDFSTPISLTANSKSTTIHQFDLVNAQHVRLIIKGTQVADADKVLRQLIITRKIKNGQFSGWPVFKSVAIDLSKKANETLSGKIHQIESVGKYSLQMDFKTYPVADDIALLYSLHFDYPLGFLFWTGGGDEDQFQFSTGGYRPQDIYLMKCTTEWNPAWEKGYYKGGVNISVKMAETI